MEFSFNISPLIISLLQHENAGVIMVFSCIFGVPIFLIVVSPLFKLLEKISSKLYILGSVPLMLFWVSGFLASVLALMLDAPPVKVATILVLQYLIMFIYCLVNLDMLDKYLSSIGKTTKTNVLV